MHKHFSQAQIFVQKMFVQISLYTMFVHNFMNFYFRTSSINVIVSLGEQIAMQTLHLRCGQATALLSFLTFSRQLRLENIMDCGERLDCWCNSDYIVCNLNKCKGNFLKCLLKLKRNDRINANIMRHLSKLDCIFGKLFWAIAVVITSNCCYVNFVVHVQNAIKIKETYFEYVFQTALSHKVYCDFHYLLNDTNWRSMTYILPLLFEAFGGEVNAGYVRIYVCQYLHLSFEVLRPLPLSVPLQVFTIDSFSN